MRAYNRYNEFYCCGNQKLLTDILRKEWGFDGFVMSDFVWGVRDTEQCLRAGLDVEMMMTMQYSPGKIRKCLRMGKLNESHIDRAVCNVLGVLIRQIPKLRTYPMSVVGSEKHRKLAEEIAEEGMVLLENDGILPLSKDARDLVTGPYADMENVGDHGSSRVWDRHIVTPYAGIRKIFPDASREDGDIAVVCVGSSSKKEGEYFANTKYSMTRKPKDAGGDRAGLRLDPSEAELIRSLKKQERK